MSLLETYLTNEDAEYTIERSRRTLENHMNIIKQEAESLEQQCLTDEAFKYQIASLCFSVETMIKCVREAELGLERFIQNTYKKWRVYAELNQDLLRVLNAKTLEALTRVQRLDRTSSFNVVKIHTHHIEMECHNKALVLPPDVRVDCTPLPTPTTPTTEDEQQQQQQQLTSPVVPVLEIFRTASSVEMVVTRMTELCQRFIEAQKRVSVYKAHYGRLGNAGTLRGEHDTLRLKMQAVIRHMENDDTLAYTCSTSLSILKRHINEVDQCISEMRQIMSLECSHCHEYADNTVDRFIECSKTYHKVLAHLRLHKIELKTNTSSSASAAATSNLIEGNDREEEEVRVRTKGKESTEDSIVYCSSMFQDFSAIRITNNNNNDNNNSGCNNENNNSSGDKKKKTKNSLYNNEDSHDGDGDGDGFEMDRYCMNDTIL